MPNYEAARGLTSVSLLQRPIAAYVEVMTISHWESEEALRRFVENQSPAADSRNDYDAVQIEPRTYELVMTSDGKLWDTGLKGTG